MIFTKKPSYNFNVIVIAIRYYYYLELRELGHLGAIRDCSKHLQYPGTAWNNAPWGHCPLS